MKHVIRISQVWEQMHWSRHSELQKNCHMIILWNDTFKKRTHLHSIWLKCHEPCSEGCCAGACSWAKTWSLTQAGEILCVQPISCCWMYVQCFLLYPNHKGLFARTAQSNTNMVKWVSNNWFLMPRQPERFYQGEWTQPPFTLASKSWPDWSEWQ